MSFPGFELQVLKWERKYFVEKDEDFNAILKDGKPIILDAWVIVTVLVGGKKFTLEVDEPDFDKNVLPRVLDPLIRFWRSIEVGHALFGERETMLSFLLEQKAQYPALCEP
jgi:hypothetical protein